MIEKDFPEGTKEHRFIRADKHSSADDASTFAISKGKQIIDEQGDRIFAGEMRSAREGDPLVSAREALHFASARLISGQGVSIWTSSPR